MNTLELDMVVVTVEGDVFAVEHRELKKRGAWVVAFDLTDYTGSIRVNKFFPGTTRGSPSWTGSRWGCTSRSRPNMNLNRFDNDMVLEPLHHGGAQAYEDG